MDLNLKLIWIPEWFVWLSFTATLLATLWKGTWQARVIIGSQVAQMVLLRLLVFFTSLTFVHQIEGRVWPILVEDVLLLAIALACAATARRYWILWMASMGVASIGTDILMFYTHVVSGWTFRYASYIWTYSTLALALGDVWSNVRAKREADGAGHSIQPLAARG